MLRQVLERDIMHVMSLRDGASFRPLLRAFEKEAISAGAFQVRLIGRLVRDLKVIKMLGSKALKKLGWQVRYHDQFTPVVTKVLRN